MTNTFTFYKKTIRCRHDIKNSPLLGKRVQMQGFENAFEIKRLATENNHISIRDCYPKHQTNCKPRI